jgi:outer membrane protein OmpA-like peptidoglycan-associated protein/tetratricopeptide (TPR) repeat protein
MKRLFLVIILLFLFSLKGFSQNKEIQEGNIHFEFFQFREAIFDYEAALKIYNPKVELFLLDRLSQCYKFSFQYAKAEEYFSRLIRLGDKNTAPDVYLDYAAILKINGDYTRSKDQYRYYLSIFPEDVFANLQLKSLSWAERNKDSIRNFTVVPTNLNISGQSLGYCFFDNGMIYSALKNKSDKNNSMLMYDLDYAEIKDSITFIEGDKFMDGISFELNEGSPSVSEDGMLVYFSANATKVKKGLVKKRVGDIEISSDGVANMKIYVARFENGKFISPQELPFNNKEYNCMHPFITDNGNTLYFASDMPKGLGGTDIYKVTRIADGKWGTPENLGQGINTTENEIYPSVSGKVLFFTSKGLNGFGGYDLYQAKINLGIPSAPINMGKPFNSSKDDIAFVCRQDGRTGYFSSNRDNGEGLDKVYYYFDNKLLSEIQPVLASVETKKAEEPAKQNPVTIASLETPKVDAPKTVNPIPIPPVIVTKPAAPKPEIAKPTPPIIAAKPVDLKPEIVKAKPPIIVSKPVALKPEKVKPKPLVESGVSDEVLTKIVFDKVLFKFNDVSIPISIYPTLDSAIHASRKSKTVKIQVSAHTDSRGSAEYNQKLSERRAAIVKQYLMKKGVAKSRIISNGFGETQLLNQCSDGVECTDEQHQQNRRVEIKIVK